MSNSRILFILHGKMIFEAKDIDDAFMEISKHYKEMAIGKDGIDLQPETDIYLEPLEDYRTSRIKGQK